ncbi:MAPEG family protein [Psychrosphaera aquimarina]|uniref:MAPEG family protein n=1 Tax=Psychrosphaera aquimarina TaxID=2044854 RepID=A0ABU3QZ50_9GAMM|nr:MAPEG family protein [Psychrosphaera aquimarina]MDU0112415.1 MAPEG family protein [Psychrosphaera aquimarina]
MDATALLQPVMVVALLTLVITLWVLFTRIPAMVRLRIHPQKVQDTSKFKDLLPPEINRISNNYNNLFEQPTLFYAVAGVIAILGHVDMINVYCAWAYAVFRIVHSLVQATVDIVRLRFAIFVLSWITLAIMIVRESITIFS